jgi:hypothetical protein
MKLTYLFLLFSFHCITLRAIEILANQSIFPDQSVGNASWDIFFFDIFPHFIEHRACHTLEYKSYVEDYSLMYFDSFILDDINTKTTIDTIVFLKKFLCINKSIYVKLFSSYKIYLRKIIDNSCFDKEDLEHYEKISTISNFHFQRRIKLGFQRRFWENIANKEKCTLSNMIIQELFTFSAAHWCNKKDEKIIYLHAPRKNLYNMINEADELLPIILKKIFSFKPENLTLIIFYDFFGPIPENTILKFQSHNLSVKKITYLRWSDFSTEVKSQDTYSSRSNYSGEVDLKNFPVLQITRCLDQK